MPSSTNETRMKTELEREVDQIISRRNFRLRPSTEETKIPSNLYDDQGQFSSASKHTRPPPPASSFELIPRTQVVGNGFPKRGQISRFNAISVEPQSTTLPDQFIEDVLGLPRTDIPWPTRTQRALRALHAEPGEPDTFPPIRSSSEAIDRLSLTQHHIDEDSARRDVESSHFSINTSATTDPASITPTSLPPQPDLSFASTYFVSSGSQDTTSQSKKLPPVAASLATEDSSPESFLLTAIPCQSHLESKATYSSLTFIYETAEHRVTKPKERRGKHHKYSKSPQTRRKKSFSQRSSSSSSGTSHTNNLSPIAEFTQPLPRYITPPPLSRSLHQTVPMPHPMPDCSPSIWTYLSRSVTSGPKGAALARLEDVLSEDVPIRALLHGWDALGRLSPFWRIIRQLDDSGLFRIGAVERFAIFRLMHLNLRYASEPTPERAATRPSFMNAT